MAEFVASGTTPQQVQYRFPLILTTSIPCNKGYIIHREQSGNIILRGVIRNCCQNSARYLLQYSGNIAIPTGGTVGEIAVGFTVNGEPLEGTISRSTPAAVEQYNSVSAVKYLKVPGNCCLDVALENLTTSQEDILMDQQFNIVITRVA